MRVDARMVGNTGELDKGPRSCCCAVREGEDAGDEWVSGGEPVGQRRRTAVAVVTRLGNAVLPL